MTGEVTLSPDRRFELDHVFVCTAAGAPEANGLIAFGLAEGKPNVHPGQGTSNRRFFFRNAMLELLWVHDEAQARSPATARTRLFERWKSRNDGACPFGLCFRSTGPGATPPFSAWKYAPGYLPPSLSIQVGNNSEVLAEPMLLHMPFGSRPDKVPEARRQPVAHRIGFREVTRVRLIQPEAVALSPELGSLLGCGSFSVVPGPSHALELGFDHEQEGKSVTFAPELPITFHW
jgi:hypothetical protein